MGTASSKEPAPQDTVLLHAGIKRGHSSPSLSPFVLKLETYLRVANIPYTYTQQGGMSAKGKIPWIEYNGETVNDSQFIINYLEEKFDVGINKSLSDEEKAMSTAFRVMTEEFSLYAFELEMISWNDADGLRAIVGDIMSLPLPLVWLYQSQTNKKAKSQGIGAHSKEEIRQLAEEQLFAISTFLGDKTYFLGEQPTEVDCTMMGMLGMVKWNMKGLYLHNLVNEKFPNINKYLDRMKANFYPDWNELISSGKKDNNAQGGKNV